MSELKAENERLRGESCKLTDGGCVTKSTHHRRKGSKKGCGIG